MTAGTLVLLPVRPLGTCQLQGLDGRRGLGCCGRPRHAARRRRLPINTSCWGGQKIRRRLCVVGFGAPGAGPVLRDRVLRPLPGRALWAGRTRTGTRRTR